MFKGYGQMDCLLAIKGSVIVRVDAHLQPKKLAIIPAVVIEEIKEVQEPEVELSED